MMDNIQKLNQTFRTAGRVAAALLLAGVWACESADGISAPEASLAAVTPAAELEIHTATLQWLITNKGATGVDAYCVSTGFPEADVDAGADLLNRFAGHTPPVVAYSNCTISISGDTYNPTGGLAEWFFLGVPTVTKQGAEIDAGFHINGRLSERFHCTLRQTGSTYAIRRCDLTFAA